MAKSLLTFLLLISFYACSLAPLTSTKSARSLGRDNWDMALGFSPSPTISFGKGLTENFDAGIIIESQMMPQIAAWGKYSFINKPDKGYSLALYGGLFQALDFTNSQGAFIAPVYSYRYDWFEVYFLPRYNWVHWDAGELNSDDRDDSLFDTINWESENLSYMQYTLGFNFWIGENSALNISAQYWSFFNSETKNDTILPGVEVIHNF